MPLFLLTILMVFALVLQPAWGAFSNLIPQGQKEAFILAKGTWQCKIEDIKPNRYYLFSLRIKREGWREEEYPAIKIFDQALYLNELFSWGKWLKLSWILDSKDHNSTELLLINPGMTHKIAFHNLCLTEFTIQLLTPGPGEVLEISNPELTWTMPETGKILDIKIALSRDPYFRETVVRESVSPLGNAYPLNEELAEGRWYWRVKAFKNGKQIAASEISSFIVKGQEKGPADNQITGFFPIGIYGAGPQDFPELTQAGFNSVKCPSANTKSIEGYIAAAEKNGLKVLLSLPGEIWKKEIDMTPFFEKMGASPSVLAWYLADEPEGRAVPPSYVWKLGRYVQARDPSHPTALVLVRSKKAWDYGPAADIMMVDPYPIPRIPLTWLSDSLQEARKAIFYEKPVWAVVQAFDWSAFPVDGDKREWGRNPTYEEERCLTYLSLVHGAKGIFYYTFKGGKYYIKDHPRHWEAVKRIVRELNQIYPLLLAPQPSQTLTNKSIHYVIKTVDEELAARYNGIIQEGRYLIAVNVANRKIQTALNIPSSFKTRARALFEDRTIPMDKGKLVDQFGPYEVRIYRLETG